MSIEFEKELRPLFGELERHCRGLCLGDPRMDPQDVLQISLEKAFRKFSQLNDRSAFKAWMYSVVTRTYLSEKRRSFFRYTNRFSDESVSSQIRHASAASPPPEVVLDLAKALKSLSARERSALTLFHISGFSVKEVSELQKDRSLSATKSRLARAREKVRSHFGEIEHPQAGPSSLKIKLEETDEPVS